MSMVRKPLQKRPFVGPVPAGPVPSGPDILRGGGDLRLRCVKPLFPSPFRAAEGASVSSVVESAQHKNYGIMLA